MPTSVTENLNLSDLLTPAEVEFFATQREEAQAVLDSQEAEELTAIRAHFASERICLNRRVLLSVLSVSAINTPASEEPPVIYSTLTDMSVRVEKPVEKPVLNILNETSGTVCGTPSHNGQIIQESTLTEVLADNFTQVAPTPTPTPEVLVPLPIGLPKGMLSTTQMVERLGVAPSTFSGYIKGGLIAPAGQHLLRGIKANHYAPTQIAELREALRLRMIGAVTGAQEHTTETLLPSTEAAAYLGVTPSALAKAVSIGRLSAHKRSGAGQKTIYKVAELDRYREQKAVNLSRSAQNLNQPKATDTAKPPAKPPAKQEPTFDINEEGRYNQIEQGKTTYRFAKIFYLARRTTDTRYLWDCQPSTECDPGWELIEEWRCNGLGRWESTPEVPGHVGTKNGVTMGARGYTVPVLG